MRLLPRSLFGRLMLTLIAGLILAQVLSTMILLKDRDEYFRRGFGSDLVQRITAIVNLIESLPENDQASIIKAFNTPTFRVFTAPSPAPAPPQSIVAEHLTAMLRRQLPQHQLSEIIFSPSFHFSGHHHHPAAGKDGKRPAKAWNRRNGRRPLPGFQAGVRIQDGRWLNFNNALPREFRGWPGRILAYLAALIVSIALISLLAVRLVTRPLNRLSDAAEQLGRDIHSPPLDETGPSEVHRAATAFNTMQRRLRRYIEDRGKLLAAVSHDLKTPITRLRLRAEILEDSDLKTRMTRDLDEMEQMVNASLDFMRGSESSEATVPVDVPALLESLQDDWHEQGAEMEIASSEGILPYPGRPLALKRCLGNLVENAIRYGNRAKVRLRQTESELVIIVADDGAGVPEEELEKLFKPFFRREGSRSRATGGTGLGLGIARNIARGHGGEVVLRNGRKRGLEAVVTLPRPG